MCFLLPTIRLQKEGSDDSTHSSERLCPQVKGEEELGEVHVKGESTESELEEEEEDEDIIQLREGDGEERGSYSQVGSQRVNLQTLTKKDTRVPYYGDLGAC